MAGNITKEQFEKFCKDFVEKYEGRYFQDIARELGIKGRVTNDLITKNYKLSSPDFSNPILLYTDYINAPLFMSGYCILINGSFGEINIKFGNIEDAYKFFKIGERTEKTSPKIVLNVSLEDLKKVYIEKFCKEHSIEISDVSLNVVK